MVIPAFRPMLASADAPWPAEAVIEPKWDGVRTIVTVRADGALELRTRNGNDVTSHYPELHAVPASMRGREVVLDGEVVAVDVRGRSSFQRLQRRMHVVRPSVALRREVPVYLVLFDVLWLDGTDLTGASLTHRRAALETLFVSPSGSWQITSRLPGPVTDDLLDAARSAGLEGLILKRDGPYLPGRRSKDWVKVKFRRSIDAVVGGRSIERRSLAIGVHLGGALRYVGQVGIALPHRQADQLDEFLRRLRQPTTPFADLADGDSLHFVRPHVVVEVSFAEITDAGTLRQPVLEQVRPDRDARDVVADGDLAAVLDRRRGDVPLGGGSWGARRRPPSADPGPTGRQPRRPSPRRP